jgi:hypothetical protein
VLDSRWRAPAFGLLAFLSLAGCDGNAPAVRMQFVDDADGKPLAGVKAIYCASAWEGTLTGHGGRTKTLFRVEATSGADGTLAIGAQSFDAYPFGMSTNFDHSRMMVSKAGYRYQKILNSGSSLGSRDAAMRWAYEGAIIRLRRAATPAEEAPPKSYGFAGECD